MNDLIINELKKCNIAQIPPFINTDEKIVISKGARSNPNLETLSINKKYIIELENYILTPSNTFSLHSNWNNGIIPKHKVMYCILIQAAGKMFKFDCLGFNLETSELISDRWVGWLPRAGFKVIKEIE